MKRIETKRNAWLYASEWCVLRCIHFVAFSGWKSQLHRGYTHQLRPKTDKRTFPIVASCQRSCTDSFTYTHIFLFLRYFRSVISKVFFFYFTITNKTRKMSVASYLFGAFSTWSIRWSKCYHEFTLSSAQLNLSNKLIKLNGFRGFICFFVIFAELRLHTYMITKLTIASYARMLWLKWKWWHIEQMKRK